MPWKDKSFWKHNETPKERLKRKERVLKALDEANGYRSKAAEILNLGEKAFSKLLKSYPEVNWSTLYPRRHINNSQIFDTRTFDTPRIFFVYYTHVLELGTKKRMATTIWAKSSDEAKDLVRSKVKKDNQWHEAKSFRTYIAHNTFKRGMGPTEWEAARYLAYPNKWDRLMRVEL